MKTRSNDEENSNILINNIYPWLDWFRFIAALIVVTGHTKDQLFVKFADLNPESRNIFSAIFYMCGKLGNEAVMIFFVISGFLVGGAALQRFSHNTFLLRSYVIDRTTRIMIPLIPAIILTAGMELYLFGSAQWMNIFGSLFSLQGILFPTLLENEALWTLSYEVWFYILIGAVALYADNKCWGWLLLLASLLVFTKLEAHYLFCWIIGAIAFQYRPKKIIPQLIIIGIILIIYGSFAKQINRGSESFDIGGLQSFIPSMAAARIIFSCGFAIILQQLIMMQPKNKLTINIDNLGTKLATFSYTLYLIHSPIIRLFKYKFGITGIKDINLPTMMIYFTAVISCFAVTGIMYLLFEKNTGRIRGWLKSL
jgi:hypothetical protein